MFIVPTARSKGNKKTDSGMPGAAKTPQATGTASKEELKALAARMGWEPRELTHRDIETMSSGELRFFEVCHPDLLDAAMQRQANIDENEKNQAWWDVRKKWMGTTAATDQERAKMREAAQRLEQFYPQYITSDENGRALWEFMRDNNLDPTKFASVVDAFESLAQAGRISVNPSAIGAGHESSITGAELTSHRHFHLLLQSQRRPTAEEAMSADQWLATHDELKEKREPPIVIARREKARATAAHFQQSANAERSGEVVRVVDYPREQQGVPPYNDIDKASLRNLVRKMSAAELQAKCENDPSFKKVLDSL